LKRLGVFVVAANFVLTPSLASNLQTESLNCSNYSPTVFIAMDTDKTGGGSYRLPRPGATGNSSPPSSTNSSSSSSSSFPSSSSQSSTGDSSSSDITALGSSSPSTMPSTAPSHEEEETSSSKSSLDDLRNQLEGIKREAATKSSVMPKVAPDISASANSNDSQASQPAGSKNKLLQGSIDQYGEAKQQAFNIGLGIVAKHESDPKLMPQIIRVLPASSAEQAGVHAGDRLLKETMDRDVVHLSLQRNSKVIEISIKTGGAAMFDLNTSTAGPLMASVGKSSLRAGTTGNTLMGGATAVKLKSNVVEQMRDHDVVMILDMSGSMQTHDCQGLSRWDWVGSQSNQLAMAAQQASSDLTVMLFSSGYQVMEHASPSLIPMIFQRVRPIGGTMLSPPLDDALNRYFNARQSNPNTKPLIIAIITDGLPNDYGQVAQRIIDAANATRTDGEISITFMLINGQLSGNRQMEMLDSQLGTQRDIVNLVEFDQVLQLGVKQALFEALSGRQLRNVPISAGRSPFDAMFNPRSGRMPGMGLPGIGGPIMNGLQNLFPGGMSPSYSGSQRGGNGYGSNSNYNGNYNHGGVQNYP
jgi:Mg-chelatase subunit ChlD